MFVANLKEGQLEELLHIPEPWYIDRVDFSLEVKQLDVYVKFRQRASRWISRFGILPILTGHGVT